MIKVLGNKSYGNQINTLSSRGNTSINVSKINASGSTSGSYSKPGVESIDLSAKRQQEKINAAHQSVIDKFKQLKSQAESRMFGSKTGKFNVTSSNLSRNVTDGSKSGILSGMSAGVNATSRSKISGTTFYTTRGNLGNGSLGAGLNPTLTTTNGALGKGIDSRGSTPSSEYFKHYFSNKNHDVPEKVIYGKTATSGANTFGNGIATASKVTTYGNISGTLTSGNVSHIDANGNFVSLAGSTPIGNATRVSSDNLEYAVDRIHYDPVTGRITSATPVGNNSGAILETASAGVHNESFTSYGNRALGYEKYSAKEVVFNEDARKFTSSGNGTLGYPGYTTSSTGNAASQIAAGGIAGAIAGNAAVSSTTASVAGNTALGAGYDPVRVAGNSNLGVVAPSATGNTSSNNGYNFDGWTENKPTGNAAFGSGAGYSQPIEYTTTGNTTLGAGTNEFVEVPATGNAALGAGLNNFTDVPAAGNAALGQGYGYDQPIQEDPSVTPENPETPGVDPGTPETPVVDPETPGVEPGTPETPTVDPESPGVEPGTPETPVVDPETPGVEPGTPETPTVDPETPGVDPGTPETPVVNPETPGVDPTTPSGNVPNGETPSANIPISGGAGGAGGAGGSVTVNVPTGTTTTGTTPTTTATAGTVTDSYNTNVSNSGNTYYNYSNNIQGNNFGTQSGGTTVNNYYNGGQGQGAPVSPAGFVNPQVQTPSISVGGGSSTPASTGTTTASTAGTNTSTVSSATPVETVSTPVTDASNNASVSAFINKEGIAASATPTSGWGSMTGLGVAGGAAVATAGVMAMPSNIKAEEVEEKLNKEDQKNEQFRQAISQQFGQVNNVSTDQAGIETINANPGSSSIN